MHGGTRELHLVWGGGLMHWGLSVCAAPTAQSISERDEYSLELAPGAYVWCE